MSHTQSGPADAAGVTEQLLSGWFRQWSAPLRDFLRFRVGVPVMDLEDVAQEVFVRLLRYARNDRIDYPRAYIFRVASNVAAEWGQRAHRLRPHDSRWLATIMEYEHPESIVMRDDMHKELERATLTLGARQKGMLDLFFRRGLTQSQIAAELHETRRAVRHQMAMSYRKLRGELDGDALRVIAQGSD